jgi:hypothetical protein
MAQRLAQEVQNSSIKRGRFIRIAERRVNRVLDGLDNFGKCSNRNNYEYNDEDIRKIFREVDRKVKEIRLRFQVKGENKRRFRL